MLSSEERTWPGGRFGAASAGLGSVASMGGRVGAFVIDIAACALLALTFTWPSAPGNLSLAIWAGMTMFSVALFGMTPGQWMLGLRVVSVRGATFVGAWAIPRTVLVFLIVPALMSDRDGRGLHDRLCRTIVLRAR